MDQEQIREQRFHELLSEALQLAPEERRAFLSSACGEDRGLAEEVWDAASVGEDSLEDFLERPALLRLPNLADDPDSWIHGPPDATRNDRAASRPTVASRPASPDAQRRTPSSHSESTRPPTSVVSRLRAARGVGLFAVLVLAMPVLVGAAALGTKALLAIPDVGLSFGSMTGRVARATDRWPGVEIGDEIVAVDGVEVEADPVRLRRAFLDLEPGSVTLRLRRGEVEWESTASTRRHTPVEGTVAWTRVVTGALLLAIGAVAFVLRPATRVTWLFLAFCTSLATHLLSYAALLRRPPDGLVVESVGLYLAGAAGLHLFTVFPRQLWRRPWALAFYVPAVAAVATILSLYRVSVPVAASLIQATAYFAAASGLGAVILVVVQHRHARRADDPVARARSRALLVAVAAGLALPAVLGATPLFSSDFAYAANSFLVVVFASIMAYSIVRHNALEVDRFTAAVIGYAATSVLLAVVFGGVVVGVPALVGTELFENPLVVAAMTAVFFAVFHPLYRRIRRRVDRWFEREQVEEDTALVLLQRLSDAVRTAELTRTLRVGLDTATTLHGERTEIWTRTVDGHALARICSSAEDTDPVVPFPLPADGALAQALREGSGGVAGLADRALDAQAQEELWTRDLALAAPVFANDELQGFVGLARKRSGTPYTPSDRTFLDAVASQLGIAMDRDWELSERVGPYRVLERIGTGGMAEVYLAEKHGPGGFERKVAMKRMLPHLSQDANCVAMFLDEARIAAQLHHPHIVQIYDIENYDETYYLAMELMDAPALNVLLRKARERRATLPLSFTAAVAAAVLDALAYAHGRSDRRGQPLGLVHRDVKPANVLLNRQGEIKLSDFGIARAEFRLYQTQPGLARGTPAYMSPEQQSDGEVDRRADLFSMGSVIYEMITGCKAFPEESERSEPVPPSHLNPELPLSLDYFASRALAERPDQRFATASEMRDAFLSLITPIASASRETVAQTIEDLAPPSARTPLARLAR